MTSAIIIGAGIGGLSAAAHLAQRGVKVTVVEKNQRAGGRCDHFWREDHRFDTGPTLFVMPLVFESELAALGVDMQAALHLKRVDPTYHLVFDDGQQMALTSDMERMYEQLEAIEAGSFQGFLRYVREGQRHYDLAMKKLVNRDFRTAAQFFHVKHVPLAYQLKPLARHYHHMNTYFKTNRLKSAFTFQDVYMGLSPFEAPATFSLMPYSELAHGVWYPEGGMYRVVETLVDVAQKAGVEFLFDWEAERIEVDGTQARGVLFKGGERLEADILIANADLPYVYQDLLPDQGAAKRMAHKRFSCSTVSFFWGVDKVYPQVGPHTLFLVDNYKENFDSIERRVMPANPSVYLHAPTRLDPTTAPDGQDTLIGIVPVGHLGDHEENDWAHKIDQARDALFNQLKLVGITDLESHIKFEVNYTPMSWRHRYNLLKGSTHGLAHTLFQLGYFRPHNRHATYRNLYFVGASTHPGTGMPTAMISGRHVANRVLDEMVN